MAAECGVLGEDCDAMDTWLKNWWAKSGIARKEWSGKEGEASRLKSTPIDATPSEVEHSSDEERYHATAFWNESGRGRAVWIRSGGLGKGRAAWQGRPAPHSEVWASVFWQVLSRRV